MLSMPHSARLALLIITLALFSGCTVSKKADLQQTIFEPSRDFTRNADTLALEEEDALGKAVAYRILSASPAVKSEALNSYVNAVGQVVAAASERAETFSGYKFLVVESKEINAMAAPGGYIFISRGFIEAIDDEDSLAAVLAHEVSHVAKRHGLSVIKQENFADYRKVGDHFGSAVDCSGVSQQLLDSFGKAVEDIYNALLVAGYSKDQEFEADREAVIILERAGYQPEALKNALMLIDRNKSSGGWFSTHPSPADRIKESQVLIKEIELSKVGYQERKERFLKARKFQ